MKEFSSSAVPRSILPEQQIFCFQGGYHAQGHDLNIFQKFLETIFTLNEGFLSKKRPKIQSETGACITTWGVFTSWKEHFLAQEYHNLIHTMSILRGNQQYKYKNYQWYC